MNKVYIACCPLSGRSGHDAGRTLLSTLYRAVTGESCPEIACTPRGKPYFTDGDYHFSVSHTPRHAFCALSRTPVGIDAEEADRDIALRLADKILSPAEHVRFYAADDKRTALLRLWVLKEAAAKLSGEGLRGYPDGTDFCPNDANILELSGCFVAVLTAGPTEISIIEGETHAV